MVLIAHHPEWLVSEMENLIDIDIDRYDIDDVGIDIDIMCIVYIYLQTHSV